MNQIKRHFYNGKEYTLDEENKTLSLSDSFHGKLLSKKLWNKFGFKKIGGSAIGDVLEADSYKSQFAAFCRMSWIGIPILDRKYVDAGIAIEPMVTDSLSRAMGLQIETFSPMDYEYDYFKNHDDIIGGIPDGYIHDKKMVLEIKTTGRKNKEKWETYGVPLAYIQQARLYTYLFNTKDKDIKSFMIAATFLNEEDYANPENYPIDQRAKKTWTFELDEKIAQDDISLVKKWYLEHVTSGTSPKWNQKLDGDLLEWLRCSSKEEWEILKESWIQKGKIV